MYFPDSDRSAEPEWQHQQLFTLFDDSCLIRLSRMETFPLPSTMHPWIVVISIVIWLFVGHLIADGIILLPAEIAYLLILTTVIFVSSWLIAAARKNQSRQAFAFLNKCRRQMIHFAKFLDAAMADNDSRAKKLSIEQGYEMSPGKARDCFILAQIKNTLNDRSMALKGLLLSGMQRDLKAALFLLKSPFVIKQSVLVGDGMVIPVENLSAMVLTLLESMERDMEIEIQSRRAS